MNVYDFDNTIYRGESAVDLFWYYLKQDKSLLRYVPEVAAALVRYKRGKITIEEALSVYGARVADYFFDGIFADWAVLDQIRQSQQQVQRIRNQIEIVLNHLHTLMNQTDAELARISREIEQLVAGISM